MVAMGAAPALAQEAALFDVRLEARATAKSAPLREGVRWDVFREAGDRLHPVATSENGKVALSAGTYYLHASFGQASRTLRLEIDGDAQRTVVLGAGGLVLDATTGGEPIDPELLRFDVYEHRERPDGKRRIVAFDVAPERVVRLNAGTYHVLSRYGRLRTEVRADLVVRPGETTHAVMQHRGAEVRLRLASTPGGIPIANTAWSIFSDQGEQLYESARNAPRIVLPEGDYEAIARNGSRTLKAAFSVVAGKAQDVELLLP